MRIRRFNESVSGISDIISDLEDSPYSYDFYDGGDHDVLIIDRKNQKTDFGVSNEEFIKFVTDIRHRLDIFDVSDTNLVRLVVMKEIPPWKNSESKYCVSKPERKVDHTVRFYIKGSRPRYPSKNKDPLVRNYGNCLIEDCPLLMEEYGLNFDIRTVSFYIDDSTTENVPYTFTS